MTETTPGLRKSHLPHEQLDCKVVVLTHYLPPYMSSVLLHTALLVRDFQVFLSIESEPNRAFDKAWDGLQVQVQKSLMLRRRWQHRSGFSDDLYVHVPYDTLARLRASRPDIVFSYELGFRSLVSAFYCKLYRRKLALCVCVSEHTEQGRGVGRHLLRRCLLRAADAITYNGPSCLKYLQRFHVPERKLFHFPYAVSDDFRYQGPLERSPQHDRRLLYIGQMTERKGIVPLVSAIAEYCRQRPEQHVELDCIGAGPMEPNVRSLALPPNFHLQLLGHMNYLRISQAMEQHGLMIFPTLADEWGLVVNEALQAGLPVLGSVYAQSCTTLIREGENGWLYRPDDKHSLFSKLDLALGCSQEVLQHMRSTARESVADLTPQRVALNAQRMFAKLLDRSKNAT